MLLTAKNPNPESGMETNQSDQNIPIAVRKGVMSCYL